MTPFYPLDRLCRLFITWIVLASCISINSASGKNIPTSARINNQAALASETTTPVAGTNYSPLEQKQIYLPTVVVSKGTQQLHFHSISANQQTIPIYEKFELNFFLEGSIASQFDFPYDPSPPPGLVGRTGVTVEALFLPPGQIDWATAIHQPAFRYQPFQSYQSGNAEGLYPVGDISWMVRFSPQTTGLWKYKLRAQDASICPSGLSPCPNWDESFESSFNATLPLPGKHGFVRVSQNDPRYFEFSDNTPFIGQGFQTSFGSNTMVEDLFDKYEKNGIHFLRTWLSATGVYSLGFPFWDTWANSTLVFSPVYPGSEVSAQINSQGDSPCIFQGFGEGAKAFLKGNKTYYLTIRARTENLQGPRVTGKPYGLVVKFGTWPKGICGNPENGLQTLSPYWNTFNEWSNLTATFSLPQDVILGNGYFLTLALENLNSGQAFIDLVSISESPSGTNVLVHGNMNYHLYFDQASSWRWDQILDRAAAHSIYLKLVISEKHDTILSFFGPDGTIASEPDDNNFYGLNPTDPNQPTKSRRLQEYYWRYLSARWGYSTAIHSWELLNEGDPYNGNHYDQAQSFSQTINATDPNNHLTTTSFWHSFPVKEFWTHPDYQDLDYADFHAYIATTWLQAPTDIKDPVIKQRCGSDQVCYLQAMRDDSALYHLEHSQAVSSSHPGKPVVRGEAGITVLNSDAIPDPDLEKDLSGVWLHKLLFAQMDSGGLYELFWYSDTIEKNNLYSIYKRFDTFMQDIPINSGQFIDIVARSSNSSLRVIGQKDPINNRAFLWIDNRHHTWRQVVNGSTIPTASGDIQIPGFQPNTELAIQWWNTCSGQPPANCSVSVYQNSTVRTDQFGMLNLQVQELATDVAVKIGTFSSGQ